MIGTIIIIIAGVIIYKRIKKGMEEKNQINTRKNENWSHLRLLSFFLAKITSPLVKMGEELVSFIAGEKS